MKYKLYVVIFAFDKNSSKFAPAQLLVNQTNLLKEEIRKPVWDMKVSRNLYHNFVTESIYIFW